jgi:hypothetical protein
MNALNAHQQAGEPCLSIRQPWAQLILCGLKRIENRSWETRFRGRLWLHASQTMTVRNWSELSVCTVGAGGGLPPLATLARGAVIGSVEVYDCRHYLRLPKKLRADPFAQWDCFCWLLREPRTLARPIAYKGALRLWTYR